LISAILLAGGKSSRMGGRDKAFLELGPDKFIFRITRALLQVSDDVMVVVGKKGKDPFQRTLDRLELEGFDLSHVRILNDQYEFENPLAGILTGFVNAKRQYAAVVGCDMPLMSSGVIGDLSGRAKGYDLAVPIHEDYNIEPLCGVYNVKRATYASYLAIEDGKIGPKHMVSYIPNINYVPVSLLRPLDPSLGALMNINYPTEYEDLLLSRAANPVAIPVQLEVRAKQDK
jgi:molybdenum cofactor guanylyltransferase